MTVCHAHSLRVEVEYEVDCQLVEANVAAARAALHEEIIVLGRDFETVFADLPVRVRRAESWTGSRGNQVIGNFDVFKGITLSWTMDALAHELCHARDAQFWNFNPGHTGWKTNGYAAEDYYFRHMRLPQDTAPES